MRMLTEARKALREATEPTRLVVAHRALLPVATLIAREQGVSGISVVCHGGEVWGARFRPRWYVESLVMQQEDVRVVAVSSFTAGVLSNVCRAAVLAPGISRNWFDALINASMTKRRQGGGLNLLTVFRLADWQNKGLPELLDGVASLGRSDICVTVCGSGQPSSGLQRLIHKHSYCVLRHALTDDQLAVQMADADLFVLATRTRSGPRPCGEGFGLALLEAQIAGTPVVGPAFGGSRDAFIEGVTGVTPGDETSASLALTLAEMLKDSQLLAEMGKKAAEWARVRFAPDTYAARAVEMLL